MLVLRAFAKSPILAHIPAPESNQPDTHQPMEPVYILGGGRTDFKRNLKKEGKTIRGSNHHK
jgi:hypothetical protein